MLRDTLLPEDEQKGKTLSETHANMALLVMDMQVGIVTRYVQGGDFFTSIHTALDAARAASIPVIYVTVGFRVMRGLPSPIGVTRKISSIAMAN